MAIAAALIVGVAAVIVAVFVSDRAAAPYAHVQASSTASATGTSPSPLGSSAATPSLTPAEARLAAVRHYLQTDPTWLATGFGDDGSPGLVRCNAEVSVPTSGAQWLAVVGECMKFGARNGTLKVLQGTGFESLVLTTAGLQPGAPVTGFTWSPDAFKVPMTQDETQPEPSETTLRRDAAELLGVSGVTSSAATPSPAAAAQQRLDAVRSYFETNPAWLHSAAWPDNGLPGVMRCRVEIFGESADGTKIYAEAGCLKFGAQDGQEILVEGNQAAYVLLTAAGPQPTAPITGFTSAGSGTDEPDAPALEDLFPPDVITKTHREGDHLEPGDAELAAEAAKVLGVNPTLTP